MSLRNWLAVVPFCLALSGGCVAQTAYFGADAVVRCRIANRWVVRCAAGAGRVSAAEPYAALTFGAGGGYKVSPDATVAAYGLVQQANYTHIGNRDVLFRLVESISWRRASGFFFGFLFEQRRLLFRPMGYVVSTSCFGALAGYGHEWAASGVALDARCLLVANMKSENTSAKFMQRLKPSVSLRKRLSDGLDVGVDCSYALFGERQVYVEDRHKMWGLRMAVDINLGNRKGRAEKME